MVIKMTDLCTRESCLDDGSRTKIMVGSGVYELNEFDDMVEGNPRLRNKMELISKELDNYWGLL